MNSAKYLPLVFLASLFIVSPALAAPVVIEKHQIALPKMDASVLKTISAMEHSYAYSDFDLNYFTKKAKNLPVIASIKRDIVCQNNNYRLWGVVLDTSSVSRRVGFLVGSTDRISYVVEAVRGTRSVWKILDNSASYYGADILCNNNGDLNIVASRNVGGPVGYRVNFDTINQAQTWNAPRYPNLPTNIGLSIVDNVKQYPGYLNVYSKLDYPDGRISGDSRIFVPEGPSEGLHVVPRYRDLTTLDLKRSESINTSFYRLSDGYGVVETLHQAPDCSAGPCTYPPMITTYYRIHDGESTYSIVTDFPKISYLNNEYISIYGKGISLTGYNPGIGYTSVLVHELPDAVIKNYGLQELNTGSVLWENANQIVVRYLYTIVKGKSQYWQAIIQK